MQKDLLTYLSYDLDKQRFNETKNLSKSGTLIEKGGKLLLWSKSSFMLCYSYEAMEFDIDTLGWFKTININSVVDRENSKQLCIPLLYAHIIPGTDNRFMLEFYDT